MNRYTLKTEKSVLLSVLDFLRIFKAPRKAARVTFFAAVAINTIPLVASTAVGGNAETRGINPPRFPATSPSSSVSFCLLAAHGFASLFHDTKEKTKKKKKGTGQRKRRSKSKMYLTTKETLLLFSFFLSFFFLFHAVADASVKSGIHLTRGNDETESNASPPARNYRVEN